MPRVTNAELVTRTDNQRAELDELRDSTDDLRSDLDVTRETVSFVASDLQDTQNTVEDLERRFAELDSDFGQFLSETRLNRIVNDMVDRRIHQLAEQISVGYNQPEVVVDVPSNTVTMPNEALHRLVQESGIVLPNE